MAVVFYISDVASCPDELLRRYAAERPALDRLLERYVQERGARLEKCTCLIGRVAWGTVLPGMSIIGVERWPPNVPPEKLDSDPPTPEWTRAASGTLALIYAYGKEFQHLSCGWSGLLLVEDLSAKVGEHDRLLLEPVAQEAEAHAEPANGE